MTKQQAIQRTAELFAELNRLVMEWDPYGLSRAGEISAEFSDEVWELLQLLPAVTTPEDGIHAVQRVFGASFSAAEFTCEVCRDFGTRVFSWWNEQH